MSAPTTLTPEQKLRRAIKFTLDRNPNAGAPESIAVLIEVTACVLNVMRKALVALGAPDSVLAAHDDGDGDPVEQWIEAQPRRVPLAEGQQDTSAQDAEDYRKEQEEHSQKLAALHAALLAHHAWHLDNEEHDAYSDSGLCEETLSALNVNPDPGWLSPAESAKLREERDAARAQRDELAADIAENFDWLEQNFSQAVRPGAHFDEEPVVLRWRATGKFPMPLRAAIRAARNAGGAKCILCGGHGMNQDTGRKCECQGGAK